MISMIQFRVFKNLRPLKSFILNFAISFSFIILKLQYLFSWLIVGILHKDLTFTRRTAIWETAIENISKKPFLGYGTVRSGRLAINLQEYLGFYYYSFSHNIFLEILIQGGFLALVLYVMFYILADKSIKKTNLDSNNVSILYVTVFIMLFLQFSEVAIYIPVASLPLFLCFYTKELHEEKIL